MIPGSEERPPRRQLSHATAFLMQTSACLRNPGPSCAPGHGGSPLRTTWPGRPSTLAAGGREGGGEASSPLGFPRALCPPVLVASDPRQPADRRSWSWVSAGRPSSGEMLLRGQGRPSCGASLGVPRTFLCSARGKPGSLSIN